MVNLTLEYRFVRCFLYVSDPCEHDGTGESIDGTGAKAVAAYIDISDDYITEPEKARRAGGTGCQQDSRFQIGPPPGFGL